MAPYFVLCWCTNVLLFKSPLAKLTRPSSSVVEHQAENLGVVGSIPASGICSL